MDGFLKQLKNIASGISDTASDAKRKVSDIFTLTSDEKARGKTPSALERVGGAADTVQDFLFGPTRREILEEEQEKRRQTLMPSAAKDIIREREKELGLDMFRIPEIEQDEEGNIREKSYDEVAEAQTLDEFLDGRPLMVDPTGAMGSAKRIVTVPLKQAEKFVTEKSSSAIAKTLRGLGLGRREAAQASKEIAKAGSKREVNAALKRFNIGTERAAGRAATAAAETTEQTAKKTATQVSEGEAGDVVALARREIANGRLDEAKKYYDQLPDTNSWKVGMRDFFENRSPAKRDELVSAFKDGDWTKFEELGGTIDDMPWIRDVVYENRNLGDLADLAVQEDWEDFARQGGDLDALHDIFRLNAADDIDSNIGRRLLNFTETAGYRGAENRQMASYFADYIKKSDPAFYRDITARAKQSGTALPGKQDPVEGFIQEQLDYLFPDELVTAIQKGNVIEQATARAGKAAAEGADKERRFTKRAGELEKNMEAFLDGSYKARNTDELIARADQLIMEAPERAEELARTGTTDEAVATASRLVTAYVQEAKKATDKATQNILWERAADIANSAARNLTEHGRAVQAASILGRMTPEGMVRYAARSIQRHNEMVEKAKSPVERTIGNLFGDTKSGKALKKVPELSGEQASRIQKEMERIADIADDTERAMEFQKLDDEIKAMVPSSLYQKIVTVWKAGLLTGLKTTGLNVASNVSHTLTEVVKDVPAALVDRIASMFTGKRTLASTLGGTPSGVKEGAVKGWRYFRTGFDERDVGAKLDHRKVNFGNSKFAKSIQNYEETVFRAIGSQDQPFYYAAKARSLFSQAIAQAKNEGLKGAKAKKFIEDLVSNPTDDMLKYAVLDAETSVFQNRTALGKAARAIQNLPGGQIVLPFGKTPSAVATQIINYSPVGIVKTLAENIGKGKFDQRLFSQGIGRGVTGTGILYLGGELYDTGQMALDYPSSEREREQWELEGKRSNSINVDGRWRNAAVLGPAGLLLIIGGQMKRGINETGSFVGGLASAAGGFGATLTEQSFLKGINDTISAIQDPERSFRGWASSLAGSIVPTLISDIARATDKYERQAPTPGTRIKSRIPGVRQGLEPKVDTLGNRVETPGFLETMIDATRPGNPSMDPNDPVVKELSRLAGEGFLATPTQLGPSAGYESLSPEENSKLWQVAGQASKQSIENLMASRSWSRMDDEQKADAISDVVGDAKTEARARAVVSATAGLTDAELRRKLAEMKDDGLLTQNVFNRYISLTRE